MEYHLRLGKAISRPSHLGHDVLGLDVHMARMDVQLKLLPSLGGNQLGDVAGWVSQLANHAGLRLGDEIARNFSGDELRENRSSESHYPRPPPK